MALTTSNMIQLGKIAPIFTLPNTIDEKSYTLQADGAIKVIMFICNHCPYVVHVMPEIRRIVDDYRNLGVDFIAISSNDVVTYPADGPEFMKLFFENYSLDIPYLYDETQEVAKAYDAACTPDFYIFDNHLILRYRGRLDESKPRESELKPLTGKDIREALNTMLANQQMPEMQYPSIGCNIKWKA